MHSGRNGATARQRSFRICFRVRSLAAFVDYAGATSVGDVPAQAEHTARLQEAKLFAAFVPPPTPTPVPVAPTAAPTAAPTPVPVVTRPMPLPENVAVPAPAAPYRQPGEKPQFHFGVLTLSGILRIG